MDTTEIYGQLINEALKLDANDPKSNWAGFAIAIVLGLGFFCLAGFAIALRRYERYRDKQDAANELRWTQEAEAKLRGREWLDGKSDQRFDKLEAHTEKFFDEMEVAAKEDRDRIRKIEDALLKMSLELEQLRKSKGT